MMCKKGDKIELIEMPDDPNPIPCGTTGTVKYVSPTLDQGKNAFTQVWVDWDNGSRLMLCVPPDRFRIIDE